MARARNIKPGFFKNEELADLGPEAMLLFAGLWTLADKEGRLEDRPRRIKAELFPYFDINVHDLLESLADGRFILRYSVGGSSYIQVVNFKSHQRPHSNESESVIPPCPAFPSNTEGLSPMVDSAAHQGEQGFGLNTRTLIPDTGSSDSLIPDTGLLNTHDAPAARVRALYPPEFEVFWTLYPRKEPSKKEAAKSWLKVFAVDKPPNTSDIMAGLERWLPVFAVTDPVKVPHATTWLNQERWTVDTPARASPNGTNRSKAYEFADYAMNLERES